MAQAIVNEMSTAVNGKLADFEARLLLAEAGQSPIQSLLSEFGNFKKEVLAMVETIREKVDLMDCRIDELDTKSRRNHILVHGVQELPNEETGKLLSNIFVEHMRILDFSTDSLENYYRIGHNKDNGKCRPILVKFHNYRDRSNIWAKKSALKGTKFMISESLTTLRRQIFTEARAAFKTSCWTRDGCIMVILPDNRRREIRSHQDLLNAIASLPASSSTTGSTSAPTGQERISLKPQPRPKTATFKKQRNMPSLRPRTVANIKH